MKTTFRPVFGWTSWPIVFFLPMLVACSTELDPPAYMHWVENYDNGLHQRQTVGAYALDLQFKPASYLLLQQQGLHLEEEQLLDTAAQAGMQHYTLTLELAIGKGDFLAYQVTNYEEQQHKLYYFSYLFGEDIYLEEDGQKFPCQLFHFERSYDLKPSRSFVLAFKSPSNGKALAHLVIDSPWLQTGPVKFVVNPHTSPSLKL